MFVADTSYRRSRIIRRTSNATTTASRNRSWAIVLDNWSDGDNLLDNCTRTIRAIISRDTDTRRVNCISCRSLRGRMVVTSNAVCSAPTALARLTATINCRSNIVRTMSVGFVRGQDLGSQRADGTVGNFRRTRGDGVDVTDCDSRNNWARAGYHGRVACCKDRCMGA